jgi:hypothetical protein
MIYTQGIPKTFLQLKKLVFVKIIDALLEFHNIRTNEERNFRVEY